MVAFITTEAVGEMSTKVDIYWWDGSDNVDTVSKMSTKVDFTLLKRWILN